MDIRSDLGACRSSASSHPLCDGTLSASVWPSPRQTPDPLCPHPSDRTPPDATMKRVNAPSAWTSPSGLDKKESDGRDPPLCSSLQRNVQWELFRNIFSFLIFSQFYCNFFYRIVGVKSAFYFSHSITLQYFEQSFEPAICVSIE